MKQSYETVPPRLTLTFLERKHVGSVYRNLDNGKFVLYLLGRNAPVPSSQIKYYEGTAIISFDVEAFDELPESNPEGITDGVLLVTNNGGEATAIDVTWVTGVEDPAEACEAFFNLPRSQQKSYIHPRLLENIIVK